jgi:lipopolysaccharide biosynthesis protein
MADTPHRESRDPGTVYLYAFTGRGQQLPGDVRFALEQLRTAGGRVIVLHGSDVRESVQRELSGLADSVLDAGDRAFRPRWYAVGWEFLGDIESDASVVLTGDSWLGPLASLDAINERMTDAALDVWQMVENAQATREFFPEEGFPDHARPWAWTHVRGALISSSDWRSAPLFGIDESSGAEWNVVPYFAAAGWRTGYAFAAVDFPGQDPALQHADLLIAAGCPFVDKAVFQSYPPYLNRLGVVGRELIPAIGATGYSLDVLWESLARSTPPKVLNTNAGMLEVGDSSVVPIDLPPSRIAAIASVEDALAFEDLWAHLINLPEPFDLYLATTEGVSAARLERWMESRWADRRGRYEVRVMPASPGRDMADFFIGCRDILLSDQYDIVVKLHLRRPRRKTASLARFFRRYQLENLLADPAYTRRILAMFDEEPGLGVVFPPMIHTGYATMGKGWAGLDGVAAQLCERIGVTVPLDRVSPLAPYGGMFIARTAALRLLAEYPWSYSDYTGAGRHGWGRLDHVQERLIAPAAGERGFHVRTVLTPEHAAIAHTSLEFKADEMFSTTRGYPVEQIRLFHRAGYTGYGGPVAITRMYVRINHTRAAELMRPVYRFAGRCFRIVRWIRSAVRPRAVSDKGN